MPSPFANRASAGRQLGTALAKRVHGEVVVLGLPRGGVVVAAEVATALAAPLDVLVVRKLRAPRQPELGVGAVGEDGALVLNPRPLAATGVDETTLSRLAAEASAEVARLATRYRRGRPRVPLSGRVAVLVDDGLATGGTARAACQVARHAGAERVVLAVPVAPPSAAAAVVESADEFVCLWTPREFFAVGAFYEDFRAVTEDQVESILERASRAA